MTPKRILEDRAIKWLTQDQVERLLAAASELPIRDQLILRLAYYFGMRTEEICELRSRDVDTREWQITIRGAKQGLTQTYTVPAELRPLMRRYKPGPETYFIGRQGPLKRLRVYRVFREAADAAKIPTGYGVHSLRHAIAVHMLDGGFPVETVRDRLRHKKIETTMIYAQLSPKRRDDYQGRMEKSPDIVRIGTRRGKVARS
jgi:integrase